jgi:hypothetical protein
MPYIPLTELPPEGRYGASPIRALYECRILWSTGVWQGTAVENLNEVMVLIRELVIGLRNTETGEIYAPEPERLPRDVALGSVSPLRSLYECYCRWFEDEWADDAAYANLALVMIYLDALLAGIVRTRT